jgi:hypothetical protein
MMTDKKWTNILWIGGAVFLLVKFRDLWMPKSGKLDAKTTEETAINRAINRLKNGQVEVASTPSEITNA